MQCTALGQCLEMLQDGQTAVCHSKPVAVPLVATKINARIQSGLAFVRTTRSFCNKQKNRIEVVITIPVVLAPWLRGCPRPLTGDA